MKRFAAIVFCIGLLLCACGKNENPYPTKAPRPTETTVLPTPEAAEETTVPATEPEESIPAETEPEPITHPLTGAVLDAPYSGRVAAVVINNLRDALPHYGVSQADMFFEVETEGGITRCLAVFSDVEKIDTIGPIRSTRTFFNNIAQAYDGVLFHCGGSVRGRKGYSDQTGGRLSDWEHVDAAAVESPYFFRNTDRYNYQGYAWEHTLFATGEGMVKAMEKYEYHTPRPLTSGLQFASALQPGGEPAQKVTVSFQGGKTTTFTYDAQTGLYGAAQYGKDYVDAGNNVQMCFSNVIALYTEQSFQNDGEYVRSYYTLTGEGTGHLAVSGEMIPIRWSRESVDAPFLFTLEDGTPATLLTGKTYIAVTSHAETAAEAQ